MSEEREPQITIRITITDADLRQALVRALNGERIAPDFAAWILQRWDSRTEAP